MRVRVESVLRLSVEILDWIRLGVRTSCKIDYAIQRTLT
jgi:hypothetical protein